MRLSLIGGLALLLLAGAPMAASAQALGVISGLNLASIKGDAPENVQWGGKTGFVFGVAGELRLTDDVDLLIQPTFTNRGGTLLIEVEGMEEPVDSGSLSLSYFTVPVLIKVHAGHRRTFVTSGLDFGFLTGATLAKGTDEEDVKERVENFDVAVNFGFGGVVRTGKPNITLELRYSQSLLNLANSSTTEDALPVRFRSSGFQLLAGVLLPMGGAR